MRATGPELSGDGGTTVTLSLFELGRLGGDARSLGGVRLSRGTGLQPSQVTRLQPSQAWGGAVNVTGLQPGQARGGAFQ